MLGRSEGGSKLPQSMRQADAGAPAPGLHRAQARCLCYRKNRPEAGAPKMAG